MRRQSLWFVLLTAFAAAAVLPAQNQPSPDQKPKPEDTEVWQPVPKIVTPGATDAAPPSDAVILFDGKNEDEWVSAQDHTPANWIVNDGMLTVAKGTGNIETKRSFKDYQLHLEWKIPTDITGSGQARGNSGVISGLHWVQAMRDTSCRSSTPTTTRPTSTGRRGASTSRVHRW